MGEPGGLSQARADVLANRAQRNGMPLPPERQAEFIKHMEQQRYVRQCGARTTNLSAAKDTNLTVTCVESEVIHTSTQVFPQNKTYKLTDKKTQ